MTERKQTYTANVFEYPNGEEGEAMDCTTEEFATLDEAKAYVDAWAQEVEGIKFAGAYVEDDITGKFVYELLCD